MTARCALAAALVALTLTGCGGGAPVGFDTPESVLYDPVDDVYLVSNIVGAPTARDGDGYIERIEPDDLGRGERYWIRGGHGGVTLHAPKGMALVGDVLWVADIDVLRRFDRRSGAPLGEVAIPGATFLNDVTADADGTVYCSDTGLDAAFAPTGTDAIWRIGPDGTPVALCRDPALGQPNGLVARGGDVYCVSWRDGTFQMVDRKGVRTELLRTPAAKLDGLVRVALPAGEGGDARPRPAWFTTSWDGGCVYRLDLTGGVTPLPLRLEQPADCGFDDKRQRLLVPLFGADRIEVLPL
ncbi:MAG: hypothetical protein H6835_20935 [Planctomycetes bacterium]|nr:hypothetical protein [Planctomycetota bacterium]